MTDTNDTVNNIERLTPWKDGDEKLFRGDWFIHVRSGGEFVLDCDPRESGLIKKSHK